MKKLIKDFLLELFFPSFCFGCKKEGSYLCYDCRSTLEIAEHCYCLCSKNPLRLPPEASKGKCSACAKHPLSGLYSALPYQEKALTRQLIHRFKYEPYVRGLAKPLAQIIKEHFDISGIALASLQDNSVMIPVPMEKKKQKIRGYNQAQELAQELSKMIGISMSKNILLKIRPTIPQIELTAKERQDNIKNVFLVKNSAQIKDKKILLVDDVYTTGSTMSECALVLKEAGAKLVWGIVAAREG